MDVKKDRSVDFAIQTLTESERRKVFALLDHLKNWENDEHMRNAAKASAYENVRVLTTSDDIGISFNLDSDKHEIMVLDITKPSRFEVANRARE